MATKVLTTKDIIEKTEVPYLLELNLPLPMGILRWTDEDYLEQVISFLKGKGVAVGKEDLKNILCNEMGYGIYPEALGIRERKNKMLLWNWYSKKDAVEIARGVEQWFRNFLNRFNIKDVVRVNLKHSGLVLSFVSNFPYPFMLGKKWGSGESYYYYVVNLLALNDISIPEDFSEREKAIKELEPVQLEGEWWDLGGYAYLSEKKDYEKVVKWIEKFLQILQG